MPTQITPGKPSLPQEHTGTWKEFAQACRRGDNIAVTAPAGSGKTTHLLHYFATVCDGFDGEPTPQRPLFLTPTRRRADGVNALPQMIAVPWQRPARTPMAFAFNVMTLWYRERSEPLPPPMLFTGADEDALIADLLRSTPLQWPYELPEEVVESQGFRSELRELFAQCETYGLSADDLYAQGKRADNAMWMTASTIFDDYRRRHVGSDTAVLDGDFSLFNTVNLQRQAADVLRHWTQRAPQEGVLAPPPTPRLVVVDDAHDLSMAALGLLQAVAHNGSQVVMASSPDVCVNMYRGADPFIADRFISCDIGPTRRATALTIPTTVRMPDDISHLYNHVVSHIPHGEHGLLRPPVDTDATRSTTLPVGALTASPGQQAMYCANYIRRLVLATRSTDDPVDWTDVMVICRTQADVDELRRGLAHHQIPLQPRPRPLILGQHRATRPILRTVLLTTQRNQVRSLITHTDHSDEDAHRHLVSTYRAFGVEAADILSSRLIGMDSADINQLKQLWSTRRGQLDDVDQSFYGFIASLVLYPDRLASLAASNPVVARDALSGIQRLADICQAIDPDSVSVAMTMWTIYEGGGCQDRWLSHMQMTGLIADAAEDDFDAVIALLRTADVYQQRHPNDTVSTFVDYLLSQQVPVDNLAKPMEHGHGVEVTTTTECAGRSAKAVIITGLQSGRWPRTRVGDSLFSISSFVDELTRDADSTMERHRLVAANRLIDEYRALAVALSRSTHYLLACAIDAEDEKPSPFFTDITSGGDVDDYSLSSGHPVQPMTIRGLVAKLRRVLTDPAVNDNKRHAAADALALLAHEGVSSADPASWVGVDGVVDRDGAMSTDEPLVDATDTVSLSPSQVENMNECAMRWFYSTYCGTGDETDALRLGTLIHTIAQEVENDGDYSDEHVAQVAHKHGLIADPAARWFEQDEYQRQREILRRLVYYIRSIREDNPAKLELSVNHAAVTTVETEEEIRWNVDKRTVIKGSIDRIEHDSDGVWIADIKTGKNLPSKTKVEEHPQLNIYQLMYEHSRGEPPTGGRLIYPAIDSKKFVLRVKHQHNPDEQRRDEMMQLIDSSVELLRGNQINPTTGDQCRNCTFAHVCPAQAQRRRKTHE